MGQSIQFHKKQGVIDAFNNRGVELFSIFQNKQFMFKGEGGEELENILQSLAESGTNATYTLKVYEELEGVEKIKSNSPDDGSFNFRLNEELVNNNNNSYHLLLEKINKLEEEIETHNEKPEQENNIIGAIISNPNFAPVIPVLIEKIMSLIFPKPPSSQMSIGAISQNDYSLNDVLESLKKHDPELELHLYKLLQIAETNPETFKILINSL